MPSRGSRQDAGNSWSKVRILDDAYETAIATYEVYTSQRTSETMGHPAMELRRELVHPAILDEFDGSRIFGRCSVTTVCGDENSDCFLKKIVGNLSCLPSALGARMHASAASHRPAQ